MRKPVRALTKLLLAIPKALAEATNAATAIVILIFFSKNNKRQQQIIFFLSLSLSL